VYRAEHADELKRSKAEYFQKNKDQIIEKHRAWVKANPEANHKFWADFYAKHKERLAAQVKERRKRPDQRVKALQRNRLVRYSDPQRARDYLMTYYRENREKVVARMAEWYVDNKEYVAYTRWRRSLHIGKGGFMTWKEFRTLSKEARRLTEDTGVEHVLDHVYPLLGERVSGLNTPANLRIVPLEENQKKANKLPGWLDHEHYAREPWEVYYG
jgi:hypothetical protein